MNVAALGQESVEEVAEVAGPSSSRGSPHRLSSRWFRGRRRANGVPAPFRGFMAQRRHVSQVAVPELPAEPLREILPPGQGQDVGLPRQVPSRRPRGLMRPPDEWKAYSVPGGGLVTIPLDGPVALEDFEQLDPKTKYTLLQRAQEAHGLSQEPNFAARRGLGSRGSRPWRLRMIWAPL